MTGTEHATIVRTMTTTPATPEHDGSDLAKLRADIDALQATPVEQLIDPEPASLVEREPRPEPTDAIGSEDWDDADADRG